MLMVVESSFSAEVEFAPAQLPSFIERMVIEARFGDTYRFNAVRCDVEIVLGFRPGIDRIVVAADCDGPRGGRLLTTEADGNAVIIDGAGRRIIIEGVALCDLTRGDIDIQWSR